MLFRSQILDMSETLNDASLSKASMFRKAVATLVLFAALIAIVTSIRFQYDAPRPSLFVIKAGDDGSNITVHTILPIKTGQMTLAHYVEHLAWLPNIGKGARPEDRDTNAWPGNLSVGYWLSGPVTDLPAMLQQLSTVFRPISLPRDYAEQERDIIMREYDLRMVKNWDAQADQELRAFLYQGNAISNSAIGTPETIKALSYDDAKALHAASLRSEKPFIPINCAALPETLIESELFGYEPGTFTGSSAKGKKGLIREADGGKIGRAHV